MTASPPEPLPLPAELDLGAAAALRDTLAQALDAGLALLLDGAAVERVSTACLQVLVAAARAAERAGLTFLIIHPSPVLDGAIADLDLRQLLPAGD